MRRMFHFPIKYLSIGFSMKSGKILVRSVFSLLFVLFFCRPIVFSGELELTPEKKGQIESDAINTFETIISLCKTERFDEMYEYGDKSSRKKISKEMFVSEHKGCGLAPSWETIQDINVEIISPTRVDLKAKIGFRGSFGETVFYRVICEMTLEDGEWRVDLSHPYGVLERRLDEK